MIVLDASTVVEPLLAREPQCTTIVERIAPHAGRLACPELLAAEVCQVLRRFVRSGQLEVRRAVAAVDDLLDLPVERYPHLPLLRRAFDLRDHLTSYDALYVALAESLDAVLLTRDRALARVPGAFAAVEVLP
jgi:predicted nucleic acid-binding protein